jgi:signal transduction histidine kinase
LFLTDTTLIILSRIIVLLVATFEIIKTKNSKLRLLLIIWILSPLLVLSFYHGNIPEYYYGSSLIIFPILIASFVDRFKSKQLNFTIIILFILIQSQYFYTKITGITLKNKLALATYLANQSQDKIFNLSYDLPIGFNTGYDYIFKYLGREPQNVPEGHLYTVFLTSNSPPTGQIVYTNTSLGLVRK